ncbi:hypothetical protein GX586_05830, partial [bacterium]|nr:hypothetical protein [bacterium]
MTRLLLLLSLITASIASYATTADQTIPGTARPWTRLPDDDATGSFRFAIIPDHTGGTRPGVFETAVAKVNLLQPDFVMCVGDLIMGYSEDPVEINRQSDELAAIISTLDMPFFHVVGNHDISNPAMGDIWRQRHGRSYYHFVYKNSLFLCLDTQNETGRETVIGTQQSAYACNVLASHPDVRWTFVFMHQPLWRRDTSPDLGGWKPIEDALHGRPATVFAGHEHTYEQTVRDGHDYIMLATAGGGSQLTGPFYGLFDHIMWVTMTPAGPRYANLMLDVIAPKDIATPATHAYAREVERNVAISVTPLIGGTTISGTLATTALLRNDSALTQRFEGVWLPHPTLAFTPPAFDATLAPNTQSGIPITLSASQPLALESTPTPRISWTRRMNPPGYGEVSRRHSTAVPIDTIHRCPRTQEAVVVDGSLADWPALPYRVESRDRITYPENWSGPDDGSFAFATAYDDAFVYVAVKTTDDMLMVDRSESPWSQDSIAVSLDAREEKVRAADSPGSKKEFETHLLYYLSPSGKGNMIWYLKERLPEGSQAACVADGQGISLEIAIPIEYLNGRQDGAWKDFQLNILVNDVDTTGASRLRWRPDWNAGTYPGAGTFRKE